MRMVYENEGDKRNCGANHKPCFEDWVEALERSFALGRKCVGAHHKTAELLISPGRDVGRGLLADSYEGDWMRSTLSGDYFERGLL